MPIFKRKIYKTGCFINRYEVVKLIGEGRFGRCYLVNLDDNQYILKELKHKELKKSGKKVIFEQEILSSINHSSIPKIVDIIKNESIYAYVLEYKKGKTVEDIIFGDNHMFTPVEIYKLGIKLIDIIKYLHERNIVHRDIRVPNVIINEEEVYLIDFGLARLVDDEKYIPSVDYSYLGHLFIHLYYSSFKKNSIKSKPWYDELELSNDELKFLKKLLGLNSSYSSIYDIERDFNELKSQLI